MTTHRPIVPSSAIPQGHPGRTFVADRSPLMACRADQRFSYAVKLPSGYDEAGKPTRLLVVVHSTLRETDAYLDAFSDFADEQGVAVMTPLFPAGIGDPNDLHNYKFVEYDGIRFDHVLLEMLRDVAERWNIDVNTFAMHGFSGGGQFVHRFLFLHPGRLSAVSIGAPGRVTLPDPSLGWWRGVGGIADRFGLAWDPARVASVPTQLIIGSEDQDEFALPPEHADGHGASRMERIDALRRALINLGGRPRLDVAPGIAHEGLPLVPRVQEFLASVRPGGR